LLWGNIECPLSYILSPKPAIQLSTQYRSLDLIEWKIEAASQQTRHLLSFSGDHLLLEVFHSIEQSKKADTGPQAVWRHLDASRRQQTFVLVTNP